MPDERLVEETTRAFVDYYDEMLDSQGISRLSQEQREVLVVFSTRRRQANRRKPKHYRKHASRGSG